MLRSLLFVLLFVSYNVSAQEDSTGNAGDDDDVESSSVPERKDRQADKLYRMKYAIDIPIIAAGGSWCMYAFTKIYSKSPTPVAKILALDRNNIPAFDRWVSYNHNDKLDKFSYIPFYAVMPLPFVLLLDRRVSHDAGRVGLLYLEAFAFTGVTYTASVYFVDRFRPDVYSSELELDYRTNGNFRNSFYAGHVAVVATSTFFVSKVYADYHPHSPWRWVFYGASAAATAGMGYIRLEAGKHFLSDVLLGAGIGIASGILTPQLHKNKDCQRSWTLSPTYDRGPGLQFNYHF
jgi:membrane-associated phospholipid phosphatase